jgi:tRNA-dependent cyclodipeptide synthase
MSRGPLSVRPMVPDRVSMTESARGRDPFFRTRHCPGMNDTAVISEGLAWDQLSVDELVTMQRTIRAVIEAKRKHAGELRRKDAGTASGPGLPEPLYRDGAYYKAKVAGVGPTRLRDSLDTIDRCILGVSLAGSNAAMFHGAKLEASVRWIAARARRCRVLVGDSMGRISLQIRHGVHPDEALQEAQALGRRYVADTQALFRHYTTERVDFEVCYSSDYTSHPSFGAFQDQVLARYETDDALRRLVHAFSDDYLARTARSVAQGTGFSEQWRALGRAYLLEEMALIACLVADGWPLMVYPGSIDSFTEIAEGRHPALPASLQAFQFVSLHLKKRDGHLDAGAEHGAAGAEHGHGSAGDAARS